MSRKGVLIFANAPYDPDDRESAIAHARRLVGKSLREAIDEFVPVTSKELVMEEASKYATGNSKGKFGNAIEAGHFYYRPNSDKAPDLGWAELKCTGLKKLKKTLAKRAKERLVIGMINFGGGQRARAQPACPHCSCLRPPSAWLQGPFRRWRGRGVWAGRRPG